VPGHWEGDLLSGPNNTYIATLVESHTRYVMLAKVAGKDTRTVADMGGTTLAGSPGDFRKLVADETEKWGKVVKFSGGKPD
jgi:IS30 family transposase